MSDLCVGSGYSYAGIVDSDVTYDEFGIPFIPSRRLKGCMRESAELFCSKEEINKIFGKGGERESKGITLGNAYIENYCEIAYKLTEIKKTNPEVFKYLLPQDILNLYTTVRTQTKIEQDTGVANDSSLRYTRVVGKRNPLSVQNALCFYSEIEYGKEEHVAVENILKATRNIGMNRNRGLGSVRCSLEEAKVINVGEKVAADVKAQGKVCITYVLKNNAPLIMSSINESISDSFVSGKSILGKMAGAFLKISGYSAESEEFRNLFLNGNTVFTNAYISFQQNTEEQKINSWGTYIPAPCYLNRLKKSKTLVNLLKIDEAGKPSEDGDFPKKLKTQYVCQISENEYHVAETEREVIYHHSRNGKKQDQEGILYTHEALRKGQYFKGRIFADSKYVPILKQLLKNTSLRFGKSKNVQYGCCELIDFGIEELKENRMKIISGDKIVVTLTSDAIFTNEQSYTVRFDEIKQQIADAVGIPYCKNIAEELSIVQTTEITGYNTKWNLKRQSVPAVKAGSVFVYPIIHNEQETEISLTKFVGERNLEGFGEVIISTTEKMKYQVDEYDLQKYETEKKECDLGICKVFLAEILTKKLLNQFVCDYMKKTAGNIKITSSTIGRVTLMLKESLNKQSISDFYKRVNLMKRESEKMEIWKLLDAAKLCSENASDEAKKLLNVLEIYCMVDSEKMMEELQGEYLMTILAYHKYKKKQGGTGE